MARTKTNKATIITMEMLVTTTIIEQKGKEKVNKIKTTKMDTIRISIRINSTKKNFTILTRGHTQEEAIMGINTMRNKELDKITSINKMITISTSPNNNQVSMLAIMEETLTMINLNHMNKILLIIIGKILEGKEVVTEEKVNKETEKQIEESINEE